MFDLYPLLFARSPDAFADYYRFGAEYVLEVTTGMGFDHPGIAEPMTNAAAAMEAGETAVPAAEARSIAAVLLGDAEWFGPFRRWLPLVPRYSNAVRTAPLVRALRDVGGTYASQLESFEQPTFSEPETVTVEGEPVVNLVDGTESRLVLATSLLHLEWYVDVAERLGVTLPVDLVDRTWEESKRYFTGNAESLSGDVREFQFHLFQDIYWIEKFERRYGGGLAGSEDVRANAALREVANSELV